MAEPTDPKRPVKPHVPPPVPGAPLPRLWKAKPEKDEENEVEGRKKKKKKGEPEPEPTPVKSKKKSATGDKKGAAKKPKGKAEDGEKGVLVEETPELDTHETRQKIRLAIGGVAGAMILFTGWMIVRGFMPESIPDDVPNPTDPPPAAVAAGQKRLAEEEEARILLNRAKDVAKNNKTDIALALLKNIATKYPQTHAASEAKAALERPKQNLPLFLDTPAVVASPNAAAAPAPHAPENVVDATKTKVDPTTGAQAALVPPANPAEAPVNPPPDASPGNTKPSKPLPAGFRVRPGSDVHPSGWAFEIVGDRDGAPMVLVPGGVFIQGRDDADPAEGPAHKVNLSTYYIDKHEVTVRQFNLFQKEAGKRTDRAKALASNAALAAQEADEQRPVVLVSAREASDYCYWAGKRLPTEAQWEAAARTPDGRLFPAGPEPPQWGRPRVPRQIDPVMSFPNDVSPYGAFDLAGNAWEWTKDWYDPRFYQQFRTTPADNPAGPAARPRSGQLVVKGAGKDWVVSRREATKAESRFPYLGFRGVLQVEGSGNAFEPPPPAGQPAPAQPGQAPAGGSSVPF